MPSVRWRKVVRDLGVARTRTVLVVLSIAVGVFAVGTIAGANALLQQGLSDAYLASKPASATLSTSPFGDDLVEAVRSMPGIADAEPRRVITVRLRTGPETYRELQLTAMRRTLVEEVLLGADRRGERTRGLGLVAKLSRP